MIIPHSSGGKGIVAVYISSSNDGMESMGLMNVTIYNDTYIAKLIRSDNNNIYVARNTQVTITYFEVF